MDSFVTLVEDTEFGLLVPHFSEEERHEALEYLNNLPPLPEGWETQELERLEQKKRAEDPYDSADDDLYRPVVEVDDEMAKQVEKELEWLKTVKKGVHEDYNKKEMAKLVEAEFREIDQLLAFDFVKRRKRLGPPKRS